VKPPAVLLLIPLLQLVFLVGCSGAQSVDEAAHASSDAPSDSLRAQTASGTSGVPEATVGVSSADEVAEPSAGPFVAEPEAGGGSGYHADTVLGIRYGVHEGYERVVVDLGTGDEPVRTVPRWTLSSPRGEGLLRVTLPSASATNVSDGDLGDRLLGSFHVVRAPGGGMFVDFFARGTFLYRVLEVRDPARLVADFKSTGASSKVPLPAEGGETVLVEPRPGARISDPLVVSGYSRNFEAANTITLIDATGEVVARRTVLGNDWSSTWGYFEATLDLPPFSGEGTLRVGSASARDGSFEGVEIPVLGASW
jgi:hypothetical protein